MNCKHLCEYRSLTCSDREAIRALHPQRTLSTGNSFSVHRDSSVTVPADGLGSAQEGTQPSGSCKHNLIFSSGLQLAVAVFAGIALQQCYIFYGALCYLSLAWSLAASDDSSDRSGSATNASGVSSDELVTAPLRTSSAQVATMNASSVAAIGCATTTTSAVIPLLSPRTLPVENIGEGAAVRTPTLAVPLRDGACLCEHGFSVLCTGVLHCTTVQPAP